MTKWYQYKENKVISYQCLEPFEFIHIGSDPNDGATEEWANQFNMIINVSCSPCALYYPANLTQRIYWIPTNEAGEWPYSNFALFFELMNHCEKNKLKVYVHCHAGAYRSPSMVYQWLRYKGIRDFAAYEIAYGRKLTEKDLKDHSMLSYKMLKNYKLGNLPPNFDLFIGRMYFERDSNHTFVNALLQDGYLSDSPQVRHKRMRSSKWSKWLSSIKTYFSNFKKDIDLYFSYKRRFVIDCYTRFDYDYERIAFNKEGREKYLKDKIEEHLRVIRINKGDYEN